MGFNVVSSLYWLAHRPLNDRWERFTLWLMKNILIYMFISVLIKYLNLWWNTVLRDWELAWIWIRLQFHEENEPFWSWIWGYSSIIKSVACLLVLCFFVLSDHQQPCFRQSSINMLWYPMRDDFSVFRNYRKSKTSIYFLKIDAAQWWWSMKFFYWLVYCWCLTGIFINVTLTQGHMICIYASVN